MTMELFMIIVFCLILVWILACVLAKIDGRNLPKPENDEFKVGIKADPINETKE